MNMLNTLEKTSSIIRIIHYPISFDITPVTRPQSNPCFSSICGWERQQADDVNDAKPW